MTDYERRVHRQAMRDAAVSARGQATATQYLNKKARTQDRATIIVAAISLVCLMYTAIYIMMSL